MKNKKIWLWISISAGSIFLILVLTAWIVAANLFTKESNFPIEPLRANDAQLLTRELQYIMTTSRPDELRRLELSTEDIASLVRVSDNGGDLAATFGLDGAAKMWKNGRKAAQVSFEKGTLRIIAIIDTEKSWLFGGKIKCTVYFRPEMHDGEIELVPTYCKAGNYEVAPERIRPRLQEEMKKFRQTPEYAQFRASVQEIFVENDLLVVMYRPAAVREQAMRQIMQKLAPKKKRIR